jgi:hypothetical protein
VGAVKTAHRRAARRLVIFRSVVRPSVELAKAAGMALGEEDGCDLR